MSDEDYEHIAREAAQMAVAAVERRGAITLQSLGVVAAISGLVFTGLFFILDARIASITTPQRESQIRLEGRIESLSAKITELKEMIRVDRK